MRVTQLDTENANRDLTSLVIVLTHTPSASLHTLCMATIDLGDGTDNLDGSGGEFQIVVTIGGQTLEPSPQTLIFSSAVRTRISTKPFMVPANQAVVLRVLSPNGADTDVDVTARLFDVGTVSVVDVAGTAAVYDAPIGRSGTVKTGSTPSTTSFIVTDATVAALGNDFYNNCRVTFKSGDLLGQTFKISDHVVSGDDNTFTVNTMPGAPAADDELVILGRAN